MKSSEEIDTMVSRITRQENTGSAKKVHVPHLEQPMSLASGKVLVNAEKPGLGRSVIPVNAASDSDSCSLFEYVPQNKNRLKTSNDSQKLAPGSGKKKKGERIVASRYLQSAGLKKKSASAGPEKKVLQRPLNSTGGSYVAKASFTAKSKKPQNEFASSSNGADKMARQEKTSTPTHGGAPVVLNTCDYSAISVDLSSVSMADASVLGGPVGAGYTSLQQVGQYHRGKDLTLLQQTCDQEYSHYLQVHYLSSLAQKCQADVQKEAMKQLSQLCNLMDVKQMEAAELEKELPRLQHLNQVYDLLEAQQGGLESVVRLLPAQQKEYRIFSTALDTTRHQIETRGILIPSSEEQYEAELANLLLETEELLGSIASMCKDSSAVQNVASIFQDIQKATETQRSDVLKCVELVSAMESLVTQETSLRIQEMQTST
ncbi:HAUS augmin-like complex subunit 8 [Pomacea canaliculata]|nr:HAUS augmin-like complex subunit 8 [Pomacea canaliculata]